MLRKVLNIVRKNKQIWNNAQKIPNEGKETTNIIWKLLIPSNTPYYHFEIVTLSCLERSESKFGDVYFQNFQESSNVFSKSKIHKYYIEK